MPRDSNGNFTLPPGYLAVTGQTILASQHNPPLEDLASSMTNSLPRNGAAPMTGHLGMGGFRVIGLAAGTSPTDAATKAQAEAFGVPIGGMLEFPGPVAPTGWLLCYGQAVSRVTYAALFEAMGSPNTGDGSTTFNIPDCRGRVTAGKDNMGGTAANRLTGQAGGVLGSVLGGAGGLETHTLAEWQMPPHAHAGSTSAASADHAHPIQTNYAAGSNLGGAGSLAVLLGNSFGSIGAINVGQTGGMTANHTHSFATDVRGSGGAHNNVQPTIILNKIIRAT